MTRRLMSYARRQVRRAADRLRCGARSERAENAEVRVWPSECGTEQELWLRVQDLTLREDLLLDI